MSSSSARIEQLIDLVDELIDVVIEENEWLAKGLPASRSKQIARKVELADLLKQWTDEIQTQRVSIRTSDEKLQRKFKDRMDLLKVEMDENIVRLKAAIEASRRRVEMVMKAIRDQAKGSAPYTAGGRTSGPSSLTLGTNVRA
jgi:hypothetical protein